MLAKKMEKKAEGQRKSPESGMPWAKTYYGIRQRCDNPQNTSYCRYGGKGVKALITKDELRFLWFRDKAFNLKRPSIDRFDSAGNYELDNCQYIELEINAGKRKLPTHCRQGHPFSEENTRMRIAANGWRWRICKICARDSNVKYLKKLGAKHCNDVKEILRELKEDKNNV